MTCQRLCLHSGFSSSSYFSNALPPGHSLSLSEIDILFLNSLPNLHPGNICEGGAKATQHPWSTLPSVEGRRGEAGGKERLISCETVRFLPTTIRGDPWPCPSCPQTLILVGSVLKVFKVFKGIGDVVITMTFPSPSLLVFPENVGDVAPVEL